MLLLCGVPMAIATIPFCDGFSCPVVPADSPFVIYGRSAAFIPQLVAGLWPASAKANWIYALPLGGALLWELQHSKTMGQFAERYFTWLMLLSPIIHAWYFTWIMPFAVASRHWGARLVSLSAFVYFALPHGLSLGKENWALTGWQWLLLWAPFVVGIMLPTEQSDPARDKPSK